jgi:CheY-like chemotaxis protein
MARRRVLLVGGDVGVVAILSEYLRHGDRYEVESIDYCDDALDALSQQPFDLMLLLNIFARWTTLPSRTERFGGIELLKQMRARHIHVPALVVSASLLAQAKKEALANGVLAFIPQPVNLAELDEALKKAEEGRR